MRSDLFKTDIESVFLFLFVSLNDLEILLSRNTDYRLERFYDLVIAYLLVALSNLAALKTSDGFNDNVVALIELCTDGIEIIYFADLFKSDSNNL